MQALSNKPAEKTKSLQNRAILSILSALACGGCFLAPSAAQAIGLVNGLGGPRGFGTNFLNRNDDGSTAGLGLPFNLYFADSMRSTFFVNNNGNITFNSALSSYTPTAFPGAPQPIIAPWWADVDTRNSSSGVVWYTAPNPDQLVVTWDDVGYYNSHADKSNSFQLILARVPGDTSGAFSAEFRYETLQWTTGDASGGSGGFGGIPAQAGYDNGRTGTAAEYFSLPGSRTADILDVVNMSNVSPSTPGLWRFYFGSGGSMPGDDPSNPIMPVVLDGQFHFDFPVVIPNRPIFIDPVVAIGYNYIVSDPMGPLFASVIPPTLPNDNQYDLFGSSDSCSSFTVSLGSIMGSVQTSFASPVQCFSIRGIDVAANLDPANTMAFVTGVAFNTTGNVSMVQQPITRNVSQGVPGPLPLLGAGVFCGWSRRLRQRLRAIKA